MLLREVSNGIKYKGIDVRPVRRRRSSRASVRRTRMGHIKLAAPVVPHLVLQGARQVARAQLLDMTVTTIFEQGYLFPEPCRHQWTGRGHDAQAQASF